MDPVALKVRAHLKTVRTVGEGSDSFSGLEPVRRRKDSSGPPGRRPGRHQEGGLRNARSVSTNHVYSYKSK